MNGTSLETYDINGNMTSYALGTGVSTSANVVNWSGTVYPTGGNSMPASLNINIDFMTNNNNMTWNYVNYPTANDTYVKTLVRSTTYSLSDWK